MLRVSDFVLYSPHPTLRISSGLLLAASEKHDESRAAIFFSAYISMSARRVLPPLDLDIHIHTKRLAGWYHKEKKHENIFFSFSLMITYIYYFSSSFTDDDYTSWVGGAQTSIITFQQHSEEEKKHTCAQIPFFVRLGTIKVRYR